MKVLSGNEVHEWTVSSFGWLADEDLHIIRGWKNLAVELELPAESRKKLWFLIPSIRSSSLMLLLYLKDNFCREMKMNIMYITSSDLPG
jgi:hypothetical protein